MQRIADDKLTQCPRCGQACERQISKVALGGKYSMSESAIKASGFTRYQKAENGVYERTAGTGGPGRSFTATEGWKVGGDGTAPPASVLVEFSQRQPQRHAAGGCGAGDP